MEFDEVDGIGKLFRKKLRNFSGDSNGSASVPRGDTPDGSMSQLSQMSGTPDKRRRNGSGPFSRKSKLIFNILEGTSF